MNHKEHKARQRVILDKVLEILRHDPYGELTRVANGSRYQFEEAPQPRDRIEWCFWMFRQIVCWALRGQQADVRSFDKLTAAVDSLSQVRFYLQSMRLWTAGRRD